LVLREILPGKWDASFRSIQGRIDVSKYARQLGGGGHILSSGVSLNESPEDFVKKLKCLIKEPESAKIADDLLSRHPEFISGSIKRDPEASSG
jgi:nanoRNase/pAp phosphatase (c-di-AMP/oligoRNAs hydrolase)